MKYHRTRHDLEYLCRSNNITELTIENITKHFELKEGLFRIGFFFSMTDSTISVYSTKGGHKESHNTFAVKSSVLDFLFNSQVYSDTIGNRDTYDREVPAVLLFGKMTDGQLRTIEAVNTGSYWNSLFTDEKKRLEKFFSPEKQ